MAKKPTSLRELAGTGEPLKNQIDDPILRANVNRILDSTPSRVAEIALGNASQLQTALTYLVQNTELHTPQYDLIANAIVAMQPEKMPEQGLIKIIVERVSSSTTKKVRDVLGWNDIGPDGTVDILG